MKNKFLYFADKADLDYYVLHRKELGPEREDENPPVMLPPLHEWTHDLFVENPYGKAIYLVYSNKSQQLADAFVTMGNRHGAQVQAIHVPSGVEHAHKNMLKLKDQGAHDEKAIYIGDSEPWFSQDDVAPDSLEYFHKAFLRNVGIEFSEWYKLADKQMYDKGYYFQYTHGDVLVTVSADDPFYSVYKISELSNKGQP